MIDEGDFSNQSGKEIAPHFEKTPVSCWTGHKDTVQIMLNLSLEISVFLMYWHISLNCCEIISKSPGDQIIICLQICKIMYSIFFRVIHSFLGIIK